MTYVTQMENKTIYYYYYYYYYYYLDWSLFKVNYGNVPEEN